MGCGDNFVDVDVDVAVAVAVAAAAAVVVAAAEAAAAACSVLVANTGTQKPGPSFVESHRLGMVGISEVERRTGLPGNPGIGLLGSPGEPQGSSS